MNEIIVKFIDIQVKKRNLTKWKIAQRICKRTLRTS